MIVFLSVKFSVTTASDVSIYWKVLSVIEPVASDTAYSISLSNSSLAPYEQEIKNMINIGKKRFIT